MALSPELPPEYQGKLDEFIKELQYIFHSIFADNDAKQMFEEVGIMSSFYKTGIVPEVGLPPYASHLTEEEYLQLTEAELDQLDCEPHVLHEYQKRQEEQRISLRHLLIGIKIGKIFALLPENHQVLLANQFTANRDTDSLAQSLDNHYHLSTDTQLQIFDNSGLTFVFEEAGILPAKPEEREQIIRYLYVGAVIGRYIPEVRLPIIFI